MAEICCVKEIQEEEDVGKIRPELDLPDHEDPTVSDEDGCKTPTSSDHKIPEVTYTLCPPAPRKPKPNRSSGAKRKLTPVNVVNRIPIDLSREIEMFFEDLDRRIKKSRKQ
ncbi:cyclin-dependent protein kinase inhibitor SMR3 [Capsella rubella]|nr:cyclin-dependent protein kinase inhibitor SMR3 [Capsella rubella]